MTPTGVRAVGRASPAHAVPARRAYKRIVPPALPPPDPHESPFGEPTVQPRLAPAAVFAGGPPSLAAERLADAIITARPGILFVVPDRPR